MSKVRSEALKTFKVLKENIVFTFVEEVNSKGHFDLKTASGIVIQEGADKQTDKPRWAKVLLIGEEVTQVDVGEYIFIRPLQWTPGMKFEDGYIWSTDIDQVIMVSKDEPTILQY